LSTHKRSALFGELVESGLLFKSFALTFSSLQPPRIQQELHQDSAAYARSFSSATFGGGFGLAGDLDIPKFTRIP
jgi:hypothetical protein